jgi:hypothetical protein
MVVAALLDMPRVLTLTQMLTPVEATLSVGAKAKISPSARGLRRGRRSNRDKTTDEDLRRGHPTVRPRPA